MVTDEPSPADWSFEKFGAFDPERADRLETAALPEALIGALAAGFERALDHNDIRMGLDSRKNQFIDCRVIIQFKLQPELYDWFFNARTGYRAQFWVSPAIGAEFNTQATRRLSVLLTDRLPKDVSARRIATTYEGKFREDKDIGDIETSRNLIIQSLEPAQSKIWIGERLIEGKCGPLSDIGFAVLSAAEQELPKLSISRWASAKNPVTGEVGEGLRAPYPSPDYAWLDLKGGFVGDTGKAEQVKSQDDRPRHLHDRGWT